MIYLDISGRVILPFKVFQNLSKLFKNMMAKICFHKQHHKFSDVRPRSLAALLTEEWGNMVIRRHLHPVFIIYNPPTTWSNNLCGFTFIMFSGPVFWYTVFCDELKRNIMGEHAGITPELVCRIKRITEGQGWLSLGILREPTNKALNKTNWLLDLKELFLLTLSP